MNVKAAKIAQFSQFNFSDPRKHQNRKTFSADFRQIVINLTQKLGESKIKSLFGSD
jgi:hypothetical protein